MQKKLFVALATLFLLAAGIYSLNITICEVCDAQNICRNMQLDRKRTDPSLLS